MAKLKYNDGGNWKSMAPSQAEFDTHKSENASTSQKGHVQLSTSTTSTSTTLAATASAVKAVNDALTSHKADGVHQKLIIPSRTSDPASPVDGEIWFRSDL